MPDVALLESSDQAERVSVVIPCFNEELYVGSLLENLADQYKNDLYEIIIVDGLSEDRTREIIAEFAKSHPRISIRIEENPARKIPTALNLGIAAARGEIIVRMDAHAIPSRGYINKCIEVLHSTGSAVVGMPCRVNPGSATRIAAAIASGVSHPFGIGDAKYRLQTGTLEQEPVDTVAFGVFRKTLWQDLGGFNEDLVTNEDYDFNYRVRFQGGRVTLERSGYCDYFARKTLKELASQYLRYGNWKAQMIKLHPRSIRWRHLVAPAFVLSLVGLTMLGLWWPLAWLLLTLIGGTYLIFSLFFAAQLTRTTHGDLSFLLLMPVVFLTIHLTWGTSFFADSSEPARRTISELPLASAPSSTARVLESSARREAGTSHEAHKRRMKWQKQGRKEQGP